MADKIRIAIEFRTFEETIALIKTAGVNILDGEARTPLINAVSRGKAEVISWLLENGAEIDQQDRDGWSALHYAVSGKHVDFAANLLQRGANVGLKDVYGNTPLWTATFNARDKNYALVKLLVNGGADPTSKNNVDKTPFDVAEHWADNELISILKSGQNERPSR